MKKLAIILTVLVLAFSGCSGSEAAVNVDPHEAAQQILDGVIFNDTLIEAKGDLAKEWYKIDDTIEDYAIYVSGSGGTAEEIAVLKASDIKSAEAILQKRVDELKLRFESYVPEEMVKLGDPVIESKGDTIVMVLTDDITNARKIAKGFFK